MRLRVYANYFSIFKDHQVLPGLEELKHMGCHRTGWCARAIARRLAIARYILAFIGIGATPEAKAFGFTAYALTCALGICRSGLGHHYGLKVYLYCTGGIEECALCQ